MVRSLFIVSLLAIAVSVSAQAQHFFTEGLAVANCHRYGREALVTDHIAYQLYTGKLTAPAEGGNAFKNEQGQNVQWETIRVDSTGKFRGEILSNGYIYLNYKSDRVRNALLNVSGNSMVYFNGEPHGGDIYADGWMNIPVRLKRGVNDILIRCGNFSRWQGVKARLSFPERPVMLNAEDATLPHIVIGKSAGELAGAVVVVNTTDRPLSSLSIEATLNGRSSVASVPVIPPGTIRKVAFRFNPANVTNKGSYPCKLLLKDKEKVLDEQQITIEAVNKDEHQSFTFISDIDGSVQYYGVAPASGDLKEPALFLSVHGAGVEAIGQARAYKPKDWGVLVAPTNRRPRGFNWEDWGRMDALEVLELAKRQFQPDPTKIFLTGHSMGGHGTWYLGATYPDKWAAIAPCAGYPTLTGYGSADGKIPDHARSAEEQVLLRASNPSNVIDLAKNYMDLGIYIHHGDDDRVVPVTYARQMRKVLGDFHSDFSYYEYPGGSHWFGSESVDWPPLFDFFKWHKMEHDTTFDKIEFVTAHPGISSRYRWASIVQQEHPLAYSRFNLSRDRRALSIRGTTENVSTIRLSVDFANPGDKITIILDSVTVNAIADNQREVWLSGYPDWKVLASVNPAQKNPNRSGTFKEAFNHRMVFVYGTSGSAEENRWSFNKARFDAEVWYYRGNGAVDIIPDSQFAPEKYKDRGVILFGNAKTNSAWNKLLDDCPIKVTGEAITLGKKVFAGRDIGAFFTWPRRDSDIAMVAVVTGTGLTGMMAADANQYFAAGSGFPDYFIFSAEMLRTGAKGIRAAGFFDNDWSLSQSDSNAE